MIRYFWIPLLTLSLFKIFTNVSFAQSNYVLPYPPPMPGSFLYKIRLLSEQIQQYWYFGNFGQFSYNLKQSDKYLVQAKTLFEYEQYLLGEEALKKSDMYFKNSPKYLGKANEENKNIDRLQKILKEAASKHIEVLNEIKTHVPEEITWSPEKSQPVKIFLRNKLTEAIYIRQSCL